MVHLITQHRSHPEAYCSLHLACLVGSAQILQLLLRFNPDIEVFSRDGSTPLSLAIDRGSRSCIPLMRLRGGKVARDQYYDYDKNGSICSTPGCFDAAVGFAGVCERHSVEVNEAVIAHGDARAREVRAQMRLP